MFTVRKVIPALCLAASLSGLAVYAAAATGASAEGLPGGGHWRHGHHGGLGPMGFVLHKLNLTEAQKTQVKGIIAGEKSQFEALHASVKANREALAATPPTDGNYPALIAAAEANAAKRVKLASETWSAVYSSVLSTEQRNAIPGIVAAAQAERQARMSAWKAQHGEAPASTAD